MKPISDRFLRRSGVASIMAGAVLVFAPAPSVASAHSAPQAAHAAASAPDCHDQANRSYHGQQVLESYWFAIEHNGHTSTSCTLFGEVAEGDIVTAHFEWADPMPSGVEVTLISNTAPGDASQQTLFKCASAGDGGDDCVTSSTQALTVTLPDCGFQVDLIYGEPLEHMTLGDYGAQHRFVNGQVHRDDENKCAGGAGPPPSTPVPTPKAVNTPGTGVALGLGGQELTGFLLLLAGGISVVLSVRRRKGEAA